MIDFLDSLKWIWCGLFHRHVPSAMPHYIGDMFCNECATWFKSAWWVR